MDKTRMREFLGWLGMAAACGCGGSSAVVGPPAGDGGPSDGGADSSSVVTPTSITCTPDAGDAGPYGVNPTVAVQVTGTNGVFTSSCDPQGNLIAYECEMMQSCGPGPNPECTPFETGKVVPQPIDCSGHCMAGACDGRCPAVGQQVTYVSVNGDSIVLHNDVDGRTYACTFIVTEPGGNYDCHAGPTAGAKASIGNVTYSGAVSYGSMELCVGANFANVGLAYPGVMSQGGYSCVYSCGIAP